MGVSSKKSWRPFQMAQSPSWTCLSTNFAFCAAVDGVSSSRRAARRFCLSVSLQPFDSHSVGQGEEWRTAFEAIDSLTRGWSFCSGNDLCDECCCFGSLSKWWHQLKELSDRPFVPLLFGEVLAELPQITLVLFEALMQDFVRTW